MRYEPYITSTQHQILTAAANHPQSRLLPLPDMSAKHWMLCVNKMTKRGFVKWVGARPHINGSGRHACKTMKIKDWATTALSNKVMSCTSSMALSG